MMGMGLVLLALPVTLLGQIVGGTSSQQGAAFSDSVAGMLEPYLWRQGVTAESAGAMELSVWRQALQRALGGQPRLQVELAREREAELEIDEVRAERRPQISFGLEHRTGLSEVNRNAFDRGSRVDAVASVRQLLFDFGASGYRLDSAELGADAAGWQSRDTAQQTVLEAIEAHYEVLRYRALVELAEDNVRQHDQILDDVEERRSAGAGSTADVLRAQSRRADARSRLVTFEGEQQRAINSYVEAFAERPGELELPRLSLAVQDQAVDQALEYALAENSAVKRILLQADANIAAARAERRSRFPSLSLGLEARQFDVDDRSESENDVALTVNLEYQPYTGGAASARVGQADARVSQARYERAAIRRELENALRSAHTDVRSRWHAWQAQSLALDADRNALEAYRAQFRIGRRSLTDLLDAQRDLFQSATQLVEQRIEWDLARFRYLSVSGRLLSTLDLRTPEEARP